MISVTDRNGKKLEFKTKKEFASKCRTNTGTLNTLLRENDDDYQAIYDACVWGENVTYMFRKHVKSVPQQWKEKVAEERSAGKTKKRGKVTVECLNGLDVCLGDVVAMNGASYLLFDIDVDIKSLLFYKVDGKKMPCSDKKFKFFPKRTIEVINSCGMLVPSTAAVKIDDKPHIPSVNDKGEVTYTKSDADAFVSYEELSLNYKEIAEAITEGKMEVKDKTHRDESIGKTLYETHNYIMAHPDEF